VRDNERTNRQPADRTIWGPTAVINSSSAAVILMGMLHPGFQGERDLDLPQRVLFPNGSARGDAHIWSGLALRAGIGISLTWHWRWTVAMVRRYVIARARPLIAGRDRTKSGVCDGESSGRLHLKPLPGSKDRMSPECQVQGFSLCSYFRVEAQQAILMESPATL